MEVSDQLHAPTPGDIAPGTTYIEGCVDLGAAQDAVAKRRISVPVGHQMLVVQFVAQSLY
jgi:hypothetical protein